MPLLSVVIHHFNVLSFAKCLKVSVCMLFSSGHLLIRLSSKQIQTSPLSTFYFQLKYKCKMSRTKLNIRMYLLTESPVQHCWFIWSYALELQN